MPKLPGVRHQDAVRVFEKLGFRILRQSGHIVKAGHEAKFWLGPVQLSWNKGFREAELRGIARILATHEAKLIEAWNETE